jgi:hypothetical protein
LGILIGFGLSIFFWLVTTQVLVARLKVSAPLRGDPQGAIFLRESYDVETGYTYRFTIRNRGRRDAFDVTVRCTLYSHGFGTDEPHYTALIDIPVLQNGSIDIMKGRWYFSKLLDGRAVNNADTPSRTIIFRLADITDYQKEKLKGEQYVDIRKRLEKNQASLGELMACGSDSFVNISLLAYDRLSGTRSISRDHSFGPKDIQSSDRGRGVEGSSQLMGSSDNRQRAKSRAKQILCRSCAQRKISSRASRSADRSPVQVPVGVSQNGHAERRRPDSCRRARSTYLKKRS